MHTVHTTIYLPHLPTSTTTTTTPTTTRSIVQDNHFALSLSSLHTRTTFIALSFFLSFLPHLSAAYSYSYTSSCRRDIAIRGHTQFELVLTCLTQFTVALDSACHFYLAVILHLQSITSDARHRGVGCQDRYSVRTAIPRYLPTVLGTQQ